MLKPKSQIFKLKFHLAKLEAVNNKVNSRVHAYLHVDNQQLEFKGAPQLKKNIAIFGSDLEYDNFMISYDQITGLYEQKKVLLVIEFETQGAYIKIGQVSVNVGEILNQKKYRVVNVYPLSKCYDKSAKVKLAVDFIPVSEKRETINQTGNQSIKNNVTNKLSAQMSVKQATSVIRKEQLTNSNTVNNTNSMVGYYKNPTGIIKSRLAQQQNVILQQRIYQYEKRMDNYRIAQNQLSQRMQQQLQRKDQKISQLSIELTKQQNLIHLITLENQSFKTDIKQLNEQNQLQKLQIKSHLHTIQHLQTHLTAKEKQIQAKIVSLENLSRTKENKEKHLTQQIQKYTQRYSQSQHQRNKIIFELENKLKLQLQKKDQHYQQLIRVNEAKYLQSLKTIKERNKYVQTEHKQMQQQSQQQDSKFKAVNLQLEKAITLTHQQQQQMLYLNQELTKLKKQKEIQNNQLDSINFSYQETVTELHQQKEHNKHLVKKIQLLKNELSLSNQTIEEQRERIIVMNKDLQVREEREYYMKEHYEEDIYDREILQNNLRATKQELQLQLKRTKQQLKLEQEKTQQEHNKNNLLLSTIQNLENQLTSKNALLMKLAQDKLYLETQTKNARQLISELEEELNKLEQEKAFLTETIMEKKIALENDKSLEWTYKIESLQNDIQLMVDKFKNQKESMKENHRKEQHKKIQEMNKLNSLNKKLKQDIEEMREKFSKRQSYLLSIQKSVKQQKQKCVDYQRQLSSLKQTYRLVITQKQFLQENIKQFSRVKQSKQKLLQESQKRQQKYKKQLNEIKNGLNKLISSVLQYMVKRYNERVSFQDIGLDLMVDGEIISYVNVAVKKFCDDHNRTRELIKDLEEFKKNAILVNGESTLRKGFNQDNRQEGQDYFGQQQDYFGQHHDNFKHKYQNQNRNPTPYLFQQQPFHNNKRSFHSKTFNPQQSIHNSLQLQSPFNIDPIKQLESYRNQLDRLKKEQAQHKVKVKSLEEEIEKHERNVENCKFQLDRVKNQLEQAQDEITRVNFVLRKKDKIIKELQTELQQLQKQSHDLRSNSHHNTSYQKPKQKSSTPQTILQNPSLPLIRDLESKLNLKSEQLIHVQKQVESLREQYIQELNEVKKLENKVKEKSTKIFSLQKELDILQMKRTDDKDKEIMKLRKGLDKEIQEREKVEEKVKLLEGLVKEYELEVSNLQQRNKQLYDQIKLTEIQFRRNLQSNQYLLNDKSTLYETEILQLKSQLSQQHEKCSQLANKNSQLNLTLNKKNQQLQQLKEKLAIKEKQLLRLQELHQEQNSRMTLKINGLNDRVRELENLVEAKSFELEQCKFAYQGRVLELERQMDQFRDGLIRAGPNSAR